MFGFKYSSLTKRTWRWRPEISSVCLSFTCHDSILYGVQKPCRPCQSLSRFVIVCLLLIHRRVHFSVFGPERGSIIEKQKLGHKCFRNPLMCMCETQATSTIYALQIATSFRHTFKGKVTSSHYTACTHYAVLYIDPSFVCKMCTSLYVNTARYLG